MDDFDEGLDDRILDNKEFGSLVGCDESILDAVILNDSNDCIFGSIVLGKLYDCDKSSIDGILDGSENGFLDDTFIVSDNFLRFTLSICAASSLSPDSPILSFDIAVPFLVCPPMNPYIPFVFGSGRNTAGSHVPLSSHDSSFGCFSQCTTCS